MPRRPHSPDPACPLMPALTHAVAMSRRALIGGVLAEPISASPHRVVTAAADPTVDAELLRLCSLVHALDDDGDDCGSDEAPAQADRWQAVLTRASELRPAGVAGLRAKVLLALALLPFGTQATCPGWASPEERLHWSLLRDVLAWCERVGSG